LNGDFSAINYLPAKLLDDCKSDLDFRTYLYLRLAFKRNTGFVFIRTTQDTPGCVDRPAKRELCFKIDWGNYECSANLVDVTRERELFRKVSAY
jgi:hypothetical protein